MKIHKGDQVKIIAGKDNGKEGKVQLVYPVGERIVVEGINMVIRHRRSRKQGQKGEKVRVPMPVNVSNVMLVCGSCKRAVRTGYKIIDSDKVRICRKCGVEV